MNDSERMTERSRTIMQALLDRHDEWLSVAEVAEDTGIPVGTAGPLLGRLISLGYVEDRRTGTGRFYRVIPEQIEAARLTLQTPASAPRVNGNHPKPAAPAAEERVWTLTELEAAVAAGTMPEGLLIKAREILKPARR